MKNEIQLSTDHITPLKTMVRCLACFGSLFFVGNIYSQSLIVAVSGAQFTTYVEAQGYDASGPISPVIGGV